jgi:hypothetical protein
MNPRHLDAEFLAFAEAARVDLQKATVPTGLECMLRFYAQLRADGCKLDEDGDMLLFQWGVYDWGTGPMFEIDLTRQVILPDEVDDDAIWQLHLTYLYSPSSKLSGFGEGNLWCHAPADLTDFEAFVRASPAVAAVGGITPDEVAVRFDPAG